MLTFSCLSHFSNDWLEIQCPCFELNPPYLLPYLEDLKFRLCGCHSGKVQLHCWVVELVSTGDVVLFLLKVFTTKLPLLEVI